MIKNNTLIASSHHLGKTTELQNIAKNYGYSVIPYQEIITEPLTLAQETGKTYKQNAEIKSQYIFNQLPKKWQIYPVVGDDAGLEIQALPDKLGLYTARNFPEDASPEEINQQILNWLKSIPEEKRQATLICALSFYLPSHQLVTKEVRLAGKIACTPKGNFGFGFDRIFYLPNYQKTLAEFPDSFRLKIIPRNLAFAEVIRDISKEEICNA